MGYSCAQEASVTLDCVIDACIAQTDCSNVFESKGKRYFFEVGKEQSDGAITGTILRYIDETHAVRSGSFRIEPDGTFGRAPAWMKQVSLLRYELDGRCFGCWKEPMGEPTEENLFQAVKKYTDSFKPGGLNEHITNPRYPTEAKICNPGGEVVATWKAGTFQVY